MAALAGPLLTSASWRHISAFYEDNYLKNCKHLSRQMVLPLTRDRVHRIGARS